MRPAHTEYHEFLQIINKVSNDVAESLLSANYARKRPLVRSMTIREWLGPPNSHHLILLLSPPEAYGKGCQIAKIR
jgi:hypothetical protein